MEFESANDHTDITATVLNLKLSVIIFTYL